MKNPSVAIPNDFPRVDDWDLGLELTYGDPGEFAAG